MFSYCIYLFTSCVCRAIKLTNFFQLDFGFNIHEFHIRMILQQVNPGKLGEITLLSWGVSVWTGYMQNGIGNSDDGLL